MNAENTQRLAKRTTKEVEWETSSEREADDGSTFAVRFITQEQEPSRKVTLRSDGKDKPPNSIKRQFSVGRPDNYYQVHVASPNRKPVEENEPVSGGNPFLADFKHRSQQLHQVSQYSVPMTTEKTDGKELGPAYKSKGDKILRSRKHALWNPFERVLFLGTQRVGRTSSRDQGTGLHGQYHLPLFDKKAKDLRRSLIQVSR